MPVVYFDAILNAFHYKAVTHLLPYREEYEYDSWYHTNKNVMSGAEIKFRGQVLMFTAVVARNPKHRPYPKMTPFSERMNVWRRWINERRQLTPSEYRNNSLFDKMLLEPWHYTRETSTLCMNATKHQPIIPYAHFRSTWSASVFRSITLSVGELGIWFLPRWNWSWIINYNYNYNLYSGSQHHCRVLQKGPYHYTIDTFSY